LVSGIAKFSIFPIARYDEQAGEWREDTSVRSSQTFTAREIMNKRCTLVAAALLFVLSAAARSTAQEEARKLFEAGKYQAVVEQTASDGSPAAQYLKGLAHLKLNQPDAAKESFGRLDADEAWKSVGQSAIALVDGNQDAALAAAQAAVARNAGLAEAQYQLGVVLEARRDRPAAADAFVKATQANPQMAYAHYFAGMNFYEAKRIDQMAVYFENFLKLAPNAPERPAVESIMRTVRGRYQ
jgi:tetratricopeptide (TPR) repeat protein